MWLVIALLKDTLIQPDTFTISGNQTVNLFGSLSATCYPCPPNGPNCPSIWDKRVWGCHILEMGLSFKAWKQRSSLLTNLGVFLCWVQTFMRSGQQLTIKGNMLIFSFITLIWVITWTDLHAGHYTMLRKLSIAAAPLFSLCLEHLAVAPVSLSISAGHYCKKVVVKFWVLVPSFILMKNLIASSNIDV